jgi:hypothetical protein
LDVRQLVFVDGFEIFTAGSQPQVGPGRGASGWRFILELLSELENSFLTIDPSKEGCGRSFDGRNLRQGEIFWAFGLQVCDFLVGFFIKANKRIVTL